MALPPPLQNLIDQFKRLPGVGAKSAQRLAFHVLRTPREDAERLCDAIRDVKDRVTYCSARCRRYRASVPTTSRSRVSSRESTPAALKKSSSPPIPPSKAKPRR